MPSWVRSGLLEMSRTSASESDSFHKTSSLSRPCKDDLVGTHKLPFNEKCHGGYQPVYTLREGTWPHLAPGHCKERRFPSPGKAGKELLLNLEHITDVCRKATCRHFAR